MIDNVISLKEKPTAIKRLNFLYEVSPLFR